MSKKTTIFIFITFIVLGGLVITAVQQGISKSFLETQNQAERAITREEAVKILPFHPSQVIGESITGRIVLKWLGTGEDVRQYKVYRKTSVEEWHPLGSVQVIGDNTGWYEFRDSSTKLGVTYIYGVTAVGNYGNESPISEGPSITQQ